MFPQIKIIKEDSSAQRFLWRGRDRSKPSETYEMASMIFGAVSSPSSAQYIKNVNAKNYEKTYPRAAESIIKRHYMDDCLDMFEDEEEAARVVQEIIWNNWISNSEAVIQAIAEELRGKELKESHDDQQLITERVLGMHWNPPIDTFTFKVAFHKVPKSSKESKTPTKRQVLQVVMSIFDPLGFLCLFTTKGKILLQVWRSGTDWDTEIPEEVMETMYSRVRKTEVSQHTSLLLPRTQLPG